MSVDTPARIGRGIGSSRTRPDAPAKVKGEFAF